MAIEVAQGVKFSPINTFVEKFMNFSLYEVIKKHSKTTFLQHIEKYCYHLNYENLILVADEARDNFSDSIVNNYADAYVKQQMHSISGEQRDLCFYSYSPDNFREFLDANKNLHYTFLPLTVHATESANGIRHDMLLIFDNRTKLVYWFDGKNREDYLQLGKNLPRNAIDILFIQLFEKLKLGYNYEPAPSWQITGTLHPYGSIGLLDFVLSTAWCYNLLLNLDNYDSPTGYLSVIDDMPEVNRFHLVYCSMLHMISDGTYHVVVPKNAQVDLSTGNVSVVSQGQSQDQSQDQSQSQSQSQPPTVTESKTITNTSTLPVKPVEPPQPPSSSSSQSLLTETDGLRHRHVERSDSLSSIPMQPMPVVTYTELTKKDSSILDAEKDKCVTQ